MRSTALLARSLATRAAANTLKRGSLISGTSLPGQPAERIFKVDEAVSGKAGKGGGFVQLKLRDFVSSQTGFAHKFASDDLVELVELDNPEPYSFLYEMDEQLHLMHTETFEQIEVPASLMGEDTRWLLDGMEVKVRAKDGDPIAIELPERVTYTVIEAPPSTRKGKTGDKNKTVVLENGVRLRAPSFIEVGERVIVNTAEAEYRGKDTDA